MTKVLILGAAGQIARVATRLFLDRTDADLTPIYARPVACPPLPTRHAFASSRTTCSTPRR